jgi:hypothetical protein
VDRHFPDSGQAPGRPEPVAAEARRTLELADFKKMNQISDQDSLADKTMTSVPMLRSS